MELRSRPRDDRYTRPGFYGELERRLRSNPETARIPALVCYAFDFRTRLGPFLFTDLRLLPAGPRAIAASLYQAGFTRTRMAMSQWNPNLRPSEARLDGEPPQMLFVSSMQIHSASAYDLIADAYRLGDDRPFVLAGGPKSIYEPWDFFGFGPDGRYSADVAVTGEEVVALELLDRIMEHRGRKEHPRQAFHRLRRAGLLNDIPGLVFREGDEDEPGGRLIDTGTPRLVQDLDELPHPAVGLGLIEPPHRRRTLARHPARPDKLRRYTWVISIVTTHGCKFHCPYCPIPAYNQFTFRFKSPERVRDEVAYMAEATGIPYYFGTDDNFFNNRETVEETFTVLARGKVRGKPFRDAVLLGTEATQYDVFKNQDLLPLCREGGLRGIWFGIEDMTAELVKKGQSPEKTTKLFDVMNRLGICPMAMMMHHDGQPLTSPGNLYGLLNQVGYLRKAGAVSLQVTILIPSVGSKSYEEPFENGLVIGKAGGQPLEDHHFDGNHCIATDDPSPWRKQANMYLAYAAFYNPLNFARAVLNWKDPLWHMRVVYQGYGMTGLVKTVAQGWSWLSNLYRGPIERLAEAPRRKWEMIPPTSALMELAAPALQLSAT